MSKPEIPHIQKISKEKVKDLLSKSRSGKMTLIFILLILLWNSTQIWLISGVVNKVDKYNQGVVDEVGGLVGDVKLFAGDLNEIRRFLLLPEKKYSTDQTTEGEEVKNKDIASENTVAAFAFLDVLVKNDKIEKNRLAAKPSFDAVFVDEVFMSELTKVQLRLGEKTDLQVKFVDGAVNLADGKENELTGQPIYNLIFDPEENLFRVQSVLGDEKFADYDKPDFTVKLAAYLVTNLDQVRTKKIQSQIDAKNASEMAKQQVEKEMLEKRQELENLVKDKAFVETLNTIGLKISEKPREEVNKLIFDVVDEAGRVKFSLILEISSGMIKVLQDNQELDIKSFMTDGSKKKT